MHYYLMIEHSIFIIFLWRIPLDISLQIKIFYLIFLSFIVESMSTTTKRRIASMLNILTVCQIF